MNFFKVIADVLGKSHYVTQHKLGSIMKEHKEKAFMESLEGKVDKVKNDKLFSVKYVMNADSIKSLDIALEKRTQEVIDHYSKMIDDVIEKFINEECGKHRETFDKKEWCKNWP